MATRIIVFEVESTEQEDKIDMAIEEYNEAVESRVDCIRIIQKTSIIVGAIR